MISDQTGSKTMSDPLILINSSFIPYLLFPFQNIFLHNLNLLDAFPLIESFQKTFKLNHLMKDFL